MHKLSSLLFCVFGIQLAYGQFALPGNGESSGSYPRIKLAGPLGQLIGGQGISLNSGLGQVLSSIINTAANAAGSSNQGNPLTQLATAASTQYINAIRSLPFGQFGGNQQSNQQQQQQQQQQQPQHAYGNGPAGHMYNNNPINFLSPDSNLYGGQPNFDSGHFGQNAFPHFPAENYFGNQYGYNQGQSSSALYSGGSYNGHVPGGHHQLDK